MKPNRFLSAQLFLPLLLTVVFSSCSGLKPSGSEQDDAYYNASDRQADLQAAARAREQEKREEEAARVKAQAQAQSEYKQDAAQPDYVNPQYKASGQAPMAPQNSQSSQASDGNTYVTNNYYRNIPSYGIGFSPYTSLGYNWMYPGYSGISWRVSSFWGPMWAGSCYNSWDYDFGYSPFYSSFYNPYGYNPFVWYNPWYYRPFYRYPGYYGGGSYWDNYHYQNNGGGSGSGGGGRVKTNLPLGGTGTGVYGGGPFGGRSEGGRLGSREAVSGTPGGNIHSGSGISSGTRENKEVRSSFWRRNGNVGDNSQNSGSGSSQTYGGTRDQQSPSSSGSGNTGGFWRGSQRSESNAGKSWDSKPSNPSSSGNSFGGRTQTSQSSSGWGSGSTGGRSKVSSPSPAKGTSGGRRR